MLDQRGAGGNASATEAILKYIMTNSEISSIRNEEGEDGRRVTKQVFAEASHAIIALGNHPWLLCQLLSDALKSRFGIKQVDEGEEAKTQVRDMMFAALRESVSDDASSPARTLRCELQTQAALFHEAAAMIGAGVLAPVTTWMAGVVPPFVCKWLMDRGHPQPELRDVGERLVCLAKVKCLQDAIYVTFVAPGAPFRDAPYDPSQMKALDPLLFLTVEHVVNAMGEHAEQFVNPHERSILRALQHIWNNQNSHAFWAAEREGDDADDGDCTYARFDIKGAAKPAFGGSEWGAVSVGPMRFVSLAQKVHDYLRALDEPGLHLPSVDDICYYLNSLCGRTRECHTWSKARIGSRSGAKKPRSPREPGVVEYEVYRDGEASRKNRDLARAVRNLDAFGLVIQADLVHGIVPPPHTAILAEAIKDCLTRRHQRERRVLFCHNVEHPSVYDVIECARAPDDAPLLEIPQPEADVFRMSDVLVIEEDLDAAALRIRNQQLHSCDDNVSIAADDDRDGEVLAFFGSPAAKKRSVASDVDAMFAQLSAPSARDDGFDASLRTLPDGEVHLSSLSDAEYKAVAHDPGVAAERWRLRKPYAVNISYPADVNLRISVNKRGTSEIH